ncbi:MAG: hypothetical protein NWF13_06450 [Candidatus Bathyarchaeota archaeon]|nr:hypothetical protein [Candidatus Bathyarchaeota archaeon]
MGTSELSPKKVSRRKKQVKRLKSKPERDDPSTLAKRILEEAKKIAEMEVQRTAMEVLSQATIIARWERNPFYIS